MKRFRRVPSPSMAVSLTALFVALGGTGYAAFSLPKNSVGTRQLKSGAVTTSKIKNGAVTHSKINTVGLTVANAIRANTAGRAGTATNANFARTAGSAAPKGVAGGDLTGSYPNPAIAAGAVTPTKLSGIPAALVRESAGGALGIQSWDTTVYDPLHMHSNTTNPDRITVPIAGLYLITANVCFTANSTAGERDLYFYVNGFSDGDYVQVPSLASVRNTCISKSETLQLNPGDYVRVDAEANQAVTVFKQAASPNFSVVWVAPSP